VEDLKKCNAERTKYLVDMYNEMNGDIGLKSSRKGFPILAEKLPSLQAETAKLMQIKPDTKLAGCETQKQIDTLLMEKKVGSYKYIIDSIVYAEPAIEKINAYTISSNFGAPWGASISHNPAVKTAFAAHVKALQSYMTQLKTCGVGPKECKTLFDDATSAHTSFLKTSKAASLTQCMEDVVANVKELKTLIGQKFSENKLTLLGRNFEIDEVVKVETQAKTDNCSDARYASIDRLKKLKNL
ncbi:MAG: hypothetical protein RLY82_1106, partial [Pseudomonadota bacterium]